MSEEEKANAEKIKSISIPPLPVTLPAKTFHRTERFLNESGD